MKKTFDLSGRVAVVIGATSGLGRAVALALAEAGATVVPSGRRAAELKEVCGELARLSTDPINKTVDVTNRKQIDELRDAILEKHGGVDILVNAFGRTRKTPVAAVPEEEWNEIIDTNLTGMLRVCQSFYQPLKASGRGSIINIASISSFVAFYQVAAYAASKAAVLSLTRSLAVEWAADGITANALAPGVFPTELNSKFILGTPRGNELLTRTPMKRFGHAEEVTGAAVFLASDAARFITGQSIIIDGGIMASGVNC